MQKMRIEHPSEDLYEEIAQLCERRGATVIKGNIDVLWCDNTGDYRFNDNHYVSLDDALSQIYRTDNIRHWFVLEENPMKLRPVKDKIITVE